MRHILLFTSTAIGRAAAYMSLAEELATVLVKTENGPVRINLSDFDPSKLELADPSDLPPAPVAQQEPEQQQSSADANGVKDTPQPDAPDGAPEGDAGDGTVVEHPAVSDKRGVVKTGSKYFVTDLAGAKIEADGIDPNGYKTEGEAWAAVVAAPVA